MVFFSFCQQNFIEQLIIGFTEHKWLFLFALNLIWLGLDIQYSLVKLKYNNPLKCTTN